MSITYQIDPVVDAVRTFIDSRLTAAGTPAAVLPLLSAINQYPLEPSLCPLLILDPVSTSADWRQFAVGDVLLSLELDLHEVRIRSGTAGGEETIALHVLCDLATAFAADFRMDGNVQNVLVESIALARPETLHRLGIPPDEMAIFAAATMHLKVLWIESCFV